MAAVQDSPVFKQFVAKYGEEAVETALKAYENQRARSKAAGQKAVKERQGLASMKAKAKADPRLAEILRANGIAVD